MVEFSFVRLSGLSIYRQLQLEEALLRADSGNWCLLQKGSSPAIVMGISGQRHLLIDEEERQRQQLPIIRRFSGGGTVVVDENTCFATFIVNSDALGFPAFPEQILHWSEKFYRPLFKDVDFALREQDYAIGNRKCGGNAQYITRGRWLHHTSFLWDYTEEKMRCLALPQRAPAYRQQRSHTAFLCRLCDETPYHNCAEAFLDAIAAQLSVIATVKELSPLSALSFEARPHRHATELLVC